MTELEKEMLDMLKCIFETKQHGNFVGNVPIREVKDLIAKAEGR